MSQSHACFCILLSAIQSKICEIDVTAILEAAPREELERLLRELESRFGSEAGAKEPALRARVVNKTCFV